MKTQQLYIFFLLCIGCFSCKENAQQEDVFAFGKVQFANKSLVMQDSVIIKMDDKQIFPEILKPGTSTATDLLVTNGSHRFSILSASNPDSLVLERTITIDKNLRRKITLFRTANTDSLSIVNINIDTVTVPTGDSVKVSLANFTTHLPENVDLLFLQQVSNSPRTIDTVARFENIKRDFSPFLPFKLSRNKQNNQLVYSFTFVLYNRDTKTFTTDRVVISGVIFSANTPRICALNMVTVSGVARISAF